MRFEFKPFLSKLLFLLFLSVSCVDRISLDEIRIIENFPIVIDGFISSAKGPYTVTVSKSFDIESSYSMKEPYSVKRLTVSDNQGSSEELAEVREGVYEIRKLQGEVGRVYTLKAEFFDGRVYQSIPDTLIAGGTIDSVYYTYTEKPNTNGLILPQYVITANSEGTDYTNRYMWQVESTYKAKTHPEYDSKGCYWFENKCNYAPPCSGYRNIGTQGEKQMVQLFPCECCTCWYTIFNSEPLLSDDYLTDKGNYKNMPVGMVPINGWTFMEKVRVEVMMKSLSRRSFKFFESIRDQKAANNSLFQPITGKIPENFIQLDGKEQEVYGLFYATGIDSKSFYIQRNEVPHSDQLLTSDDYTSLGIGWVSCLDLFPNSTNIKPDFWED